MGDPLRGLWRYAAARAVAAVPLLLLVSILVFGLIHAVPGGPVEMFLANPNVRPEDVARLEAALGLDRPLPVQYWSWLRGLVRGEWGYSLTDGQPVLDRLLARVPASAELLGASLLLALVLSLVAAAPSAARPGGWFDRGA
ncbi:MAG TPA: ABC transporter permease, partial [Gemmatimonadales bacterium]|nr:ABC transporter permease [Gemmatimonadales bacterium]